MKEYRVVAANLARTWKADDAGSARQRAKNINARLENMMERGVNPDRHREYPYVVEYREVGRWVRL